METNMIIGSFDFDSKSNTYTGYIQTLLLDFAGVQFRPNTKASDKEPAYRIIIDRPQGADLECGAAWSRTSEKGKAYYSVMIDDPGLAQPLNLALFPADDGQTAALVWNRPKPAAAVQPASQPKKPK